MPKKIQLFIDLPPLMSTIFSRKWLKNKMVFTVLSWYLPDLTEPTLKYFLIFKHKNVFLC